MKETVLEDLWRSRWVKFRNDLDCRHCQVVLDYLFDLWGIYEDSGYGTAPIYWHKRTYFPDEFRIEITYGGFYRDMGVSIKVYSAYACVFNGWVLNQQENNEMSQLETRILDNLNATDVYWDREKKLYVWQTLY